MEKVRLSSLQPNPLRDMEVDPIDEKQVEILARSIKENGFWGGVVARRLGDGTLQIACGHHRVQAGIKAGIREVYIHIGNYDDEDMLRLLAQENATQRGVNYAQVTAGSVAAAIRYIAKGLLTENKSLSKILLSDHAVIKAKESLTKREGIGYAVLLKFLPSVKKNQIEEQLANLKASGDYTRIIREVQQEIDEEVEQARLEQERYEREKQKQKAVEAKRKKEELTRAKEEAAKAVETAEQRETDFDFKGVNKYLKKENHIRKFRQLVRSVGVKVEDQKELAKKIVDKFGDELSSDKIAYYSDGLLPSYVKTNRDNEKRIKKEKLPDINERVKSICFHIDRTFKDGELDALVQHKTLISKKWRDELVRLLREQAEIASQFANELENSNEPVITTKEIISRTKGRALLPRPA